MAVNQVRSHTNGSPGIGHYLCNLCSLKSHNCSQRSGESVNCRFPIPLVPLCRFAHIIDAVPKGCRRALIAITGMDLSCWAGHYGAKFTSAELTFVHESKKAAFLGASRYLEHLGFCKMKTHFEAFEGKIRRQTASSLFSQDRQPYPQLWGCCSKPFDHALLL